MAVTQSGRMAGSVSGGCIEGAVIEAALETIVSGSPHNKLLFALSSGRTLIETTLDHVAEAVLEPIILVGGRDIAEIRSALGRRSHAIIEVTNHAECIPESLKCGVAAVPLPCCAALVCLGDMPLVAGSIMRRIIETYDPDAGRAIVVPTYHGQRGNPVLRDRRFFPEIHRLSGEQGSSAGVARHGDQIAELPIDDDSILHDFDAAETLQAPGCWL